MEMNVDKKLEYLKETKEAMKSALINKGVEVSDDDTFRSYASKIRNVTGSLNVDNVLFNDYNNDFDGLVIEGPEAEVVINTPRYATNPQVQFEAKNRSEASTTIDTLNEIHRVFTYNYGLNPLVFFSSLWSSGICKDFFNVSLNRYVSVADFDSMYISIHGISYNEDDSYNLVLAKTGEAITFDLVKYNPSTNTMSIVKENILPEIYDPSCYVSVIDNEILVYNGNYDGSTRLYSLEDNTLIGTVGAMPYLSDNACIPYKVEKLESGIYRMYVAYREYNDFWFYAKGSEYDFNTGSFTDIRYMNYSTCESGWLYGNYCNICYNKDNIITFRPNVNGGEDYSFEDNSTRADYIITFNDNTSEFSREVLYEGMSVGLRTAWSEDSTMYELSIGVLIDKSMYYLNVVKGFGEIQMLVESSDYGIGIAVSIEQSSNPYSYFTEVIYNGLQTEVIVPEITGKYNIVCGPSKNNISRDRVMTNYEAGLHPVRLFNSADVKLPVFGVVYNGNYISYSVKDENSGGWMRYV